ncbi:MAG: hypothetical protein K1X94_31455 [Sandaracinaceae bacterium]|nr:hypothetical protein [Sandaracinaceae bacterium]
MLVGAFALGAACVPLVGCGAATSSAASAASAGAVARETATYTFVRDASRTRRGERNVSHLEGTVVIEVPEHADGERAISVERARYTQSDYVVREIDPAAGASPVELTQGTDEAGGSARLSDDARLALGGELADALEIVPVGSCGLSRVDDDAPTAVIGFPRDSGVPREWPARCARSSGLAAGTVHLACEVPLDRALSVSAEARADGVSAELRGRMHLEAELDVASGLCLRAEHHLEIDVVEHLGAYEEHEGAVLDVQTTLTRR